MNENKINSYLCTRPRLAVLLMRKGFKCRAVTNPYNLSFKAWEFDDIPEVRAIVADFYEQLKAVH